MSPVRPTEAARAVTQAPGHARPSQPARQFHEVLREKAQEAASTKTPSTSSETLEAVKGHQYSKITSGPRKGMYLNQSSGPRKGEAFRLVERDGRTFHVYGSGKHEQVFEVVHKAHADNGGTQAPVKTS